MVLGTSFIAHFTLAIVRVLIFFLMSFLRLNIFSLVAKMSGAPSYTDLDIDGIHILHSAISLAMQTLFYGASHPTS